jgi:hypothetical protein
MGQKGFFDVERRLEAISALARRSAGNDQEDRAMGGFPY